MTYDIQNLRYVIISGKFPLDSYAQGLHNKAFLFWKNFWNAVFKENGTNHTVNADDFARQDMITLLMDGEEIVGQHLYSFFNLNSLATHDHSYFIKSFNDEYVQKLTLKKSYSVMSMEYFALTPDWRKKNCGISLASVLIGLACEHQKIYNTNALIGPSRADLKVTQLVLDLGGDIIVSGLMMHNTPVDLMAIFAEKAVPHPDLQVRMLIQKLWNQRLDLTQDIPAVRKKAA